MFVNTINPVIFEHMGLQIRWYGLVYAIAFISLFFYLRYLVNKKYIPNFENEDIEPFLIGTIITLVLGARFFHCFIYYPSYYFKNPLEILMVWKGGLSFHGALIFISLWILYFCKHRKIPLFTLTDYLVFPVALFLAIGRLANFSNGELVGKLTNVSWGVNFENNPKYSGAFRHPTQIYESLKNLFLFLVLLGVKGIQGQIFRKYTPGLMTGIFLIGYGVLRFFIEFLKESTIIILGLNMGQILSIFVILFGAYLLYHILSAKNKLKWNFLLKKDSKKFSKKNK